MASKQIIYTQHCDPVILVPQHISRRACVSGIFMLYNCIYAYSVDYPLASFLLGCVYITTLLFWNKVTFTGFIKTLDICIANVLVVRLTFVDSYRWCPEYTRYWKYVYCIALGSYAINEYLLYRQVRRFSNKVMHIEDKYTRWPLSLLNYTNPNTAERERAYYRSTYNHIFFIHFLLQIIAYLFVTLSYHQCNWTCDSE